jgi:hypothetical protein
MQRRRPNINEILQWHTSQQIGTKRGLRRKRIETAEKHLRRCLEEVGEGVIGDASKTMLELERQFCGDDVLGRILNAGDLLLVLNRYVREPWLLADLRDRAVQLRFADALESLVLNQHLAMPEEFAIVGTDVFVAIVQAKRALAVERMRAR